MTPTERIDAMIDMADPERTVSGVDAGRLVVLGLAERVGKTGHRLTSAGWSELGERGRLWRGQGPLRR